MTRDELETLWSRPAADPGPPRVPVGLTLVAMSCVGLEPSPQLLERARLELLLLYDGDAIDVWEYRRRVEDLGDADADPPSSST